MKMFRRKKNRFFRIFQGRKFGRKFGVKPKVLKVHPQASQLLKKLSVAHGVDKAYRLVKAEFPDTVIAKCSTELKNEDKAINKKRKEERKWN